jgi:hypothetical protein
MNFWSKSAPARDIATTPTVASSLSKMTTTMNLLVSQQQLGNRTAADQQQQQASLLPQERAPVAQVGIHEDVGALLLLQQPCQQAQLLAQQWWASLGQQEQVPLGWQEPASSVLVQQQRAPASQVGIDDVYDNEVSQLTSSIALEDLFFESRMSRIIDSVFQTPVASSNNNNTLTTTNVNLICLHPSPQSGSHPPSHSHSCSSSQIGSRPPSQNCSRHSSSQILSSTPHSTGTTNTNDDDLFDDNFAEDTQMNHLFEEELLGRTIIGETQQCSTPTFDNVAPDFEGVHPDFIMQHLKLIKPEILKHLKLKPLYKSYSWEKLSIDQKNKTLSFFRKLPEQLKGTVFNF